MNDNVKARDLIENTGDPSAPPGGPDPRDPRMRRPRRFPPGMMPPDMETELRGGPPGPPRQFPPHEESILKDVLLLIVCAAAGNDYDGAIATKLMKNERLEPGEIQHIIDEGGRLRNLPESHVQYLQKLFERNQQPQ